MYPDDEATRNLPEFEVLCERLEGLANDLIENAEVLSDEHAQAVAQQVQSDVAGVRLQTAEEDTGEQGPATARDDDDVVVDHRAVCDRWPMENPEGNAPAAQAQLESLRVLVEDVGGGAPLRIPRARDPINEFTENAKLMYGLYWFDMFLKDGLRGTGPLTLKQRRHLLHQYHGRFASNHELIFLLANQVRLATKYLKPFFVLSFFDDLISEYLII
jgi:hypothetical protein